MSYQHTQIGFLVLAALGFATLAIVASFLTVGSRPVTIVVLVILLGCMVVFSTLNIQIQEGVLSWSFGPGLFRQTIRVGNVAQVAVVQNPWYYGWGIRVTPEGWLYNVSGLKAVEIQLTNTKRIRLGTDEPDALKQAIETARQAIRANQDGFDA
ncbi:MAG: hypothetical protein SFW36_04905 [Leptolyngbyaceae cyanobacterium bins.59]|nr:hypothetical protein [Leptolyngbyaceae cyanobacterium bins.59]